MGEKKVNCGECVHFCRPDKDWNGCLVGSVRNKHCPDFDPSPLARIAEALERLAFSSKIGSEDVGR